MPAEALTFAMGLDASNPPDKLEEGYVQAGSNVDFAMEVGAARVRRGTIVQSTIGGGTSGAVREVFRHYLDPGIGTSPFYAVTNSTVWRSTNGVTYTAIASGLSTSDDVGNASYRNFTYAASGSVRIKDDGTTAFEWANQSPTTAPTVTISTITQLTVTSTWSVVEGTAGGTLSGTATATPDGTTLRLQLDANPIASTNLNTNAGATIGDYGIDYLDIYFSDPRKVVRISRDYSIGGTSFDNYWHTELSIDDGLQELFESEIIGAESALPESKVLVDGVLTDGASNVVEFDDKAVAVSEARRYVRPPRTRISAAAASFNSWAVPRTKFELVGADVVAGWTNIGAARIIVEVEEAVEIRVRNWRIAGAESHPLNDPEVGYVWWETWARLDASNNIIAESAPSSPSARVKAQGGRALVVLPGTMTGTSHGFTHKFIYRQGGFMRGAYRVGTFTGTVSGTFTDSTSDIAALTRNQRLIANILAASPTNISAISEPYKDRLFVGVANKLKWTLPGNPESFPTLGELTISHTGDNIKKIVVWPPGLIIINRDSIHELEGSVFEGRNANYILHRTGSRHGSIAPRATIKTEYGILLINQDGFYMYVPGQGIDTPIQWANEKLAPVFQGFGAADPATLDGNRVPALNFSYIQNSVASYKEGKLYVGMPTVVGTDTSTQPNTLFVLDMATKRVWYYRYPWKFTSLFWDRQDNRFFAGGADGYIYRLEIGVNDSIGTATAQQGVPFQIITKAWTAPSDTLLENISVEYRAGNGVVLGIYDSTNTVNVGTLTGTNRTWLTPALLGTVGNNIMFRVDGTQSDNPASLYNISWDALVEPVRVRFYRTPEFNNNYDGEKLWDVGFGDIEIIGTGTVLATAFIDNVAVGTYTLAGTNAGRQIYPMTIPLDTYGDLAYFIYNRVGSVVFKHWKTTWAARNEPPRVNSWQSDKVSLEENICDAFDTDVNPNGTVTATAYVDNVSVGTFTFIGTNRQSYTNAFTNELYGRTLYVNYLGGNFKHYQTWFHLRLEPDRWTNFVSDRVSEEESFWEGFDADLNCLNNTVLGTVTIDGTSAGTYTFTGGQRQSYTNSLPEDTYGRTGYVTYNVSGGGRFKHFTTWFHKEKEPDKWVLYQWGPRTYPSDHYIKTWVAELNPLGTATGVFFVDGVAVSTATFIGTRRQIYNVGMPNITSGGDVDVTYTNPTRLKHYSTIVETEPKPYAKTTWLLTYKKVGGASQLDLARFYSLQAEAETGTATLTSIWDIDGTATHTTSHVVSGREWIDRQSFPPGARGYIMQQRITASAPIRVWTSQLDLQRVGRKGASVFAVPGAPVENI